MPKIMFPFFEIDECTFQIKANLDIYNKEAITATCYKFSGKYFIHQLVKGGFVSWCDHLSNKGWGEFTGIQHQEKFFMDRICGNLHRW